MTSGLTVSKKKHLMLFHFVDYTSRSSAFYNVRALVLHCPNASIYFLRTPNKSLQNKIRSNRLRKQEYVYRYGQGTNGRAK